MGAERYACPCCGYLTLEESPPGTYEICEVCGWEDDHLQFSDPKLRGGANRLSLDEARANFLSHGVSDLDERLPVRSPRPDGHPR